MRFLTRKILFLATITLLTFLGTPSANAQENSDPNFATNLNTSYDVQEDGITNVTHHFQIKNLKPTLFVKQYGLKLSSNKITNVQVVSADQNITPETVTTNNQTSIGITFPDELVGQNKVRDFKITYSDPDIAIISGQVLEIAAPQQANPEGLTDHTITIITPLRFGLPTRSKPDNYTSQLETTTDPNQSHQIKTTFANIGGESISLLFGETQIFALNLDYPLENPTNTTRITQISLPPDTAYQKVNYSNLDPQPQKIEKDPDGNWIATYQLEPNSAVVVTAQLQAQLSLTPDPDFPQSAPTTELTQAQKYWEINSGSIQEITVENNSPQEIYDFVVQNLNYDFNNVDSRVERLGASKALSKPDLALCQEFTDLFISMARAQNIPSRRIVGYSHTENQVLRPLSLETDILHAWPEYYNSDTSSWTPVDPTWENTSGGIDYFNQFDLNHITFVINGHSSTLPYPAGSYTDSDAQSKKVEVNFADQFISQVPEFKFEVTNSKFLEIPLPETSALQITNPKGQAFYNQEIEIIPQSNDIISTTSNPILIESILPFEKKHVKLGLYSQNSWLPQRKTITIYHGETTQEVELIVFPQFTSYLTQTNVLLVMGVSSVTTALIAGSILVFVSKKRNSLRGEGKKPQKKSK